jgi:GTP-binding protein YchF
VSVSLGIVGLPNVGKSTLFNALSRTAQAQASNYPFTTIEPNVGIVQVPDARLEALAAIVKPAKVVPATVEFHDIAGIIKGAATGEGLGNKFLANIRECAALVLVTRCFENADVIHVSGTVDPVSDLQTVLLELMLADLDTVARGIERYKRNARGSDTVQTACLVFAEKVYAGLEQETPASAIPTLTDTDRIVLRELQLLSAKPFLVVANIDEKQLQQPTEELYTRFSFANIVPIKRFIPICAQVEAELGGLDEVERAEFMESYGMHESGLDALARAAYSLLGLRTFFTAGPIEAKAWTIRAGETAPQAAGVIHTDFIKGFIRAEVIAYADYLAGGGESGAREAGKFRLEGKEYVVEDGDVVHFRVNN